MEQKVCPGLFLKAAGVKSAKLYVEQSQIKKRLSQAMTSFWVDRKDKCSPPPALPVKQEQTESGLQQIPFNRLT